jgi:hypothetical protein
VAGRLPGRWQTGSRQLRVTGNRIVRLLIMKDVNVRLVSVRRVGVSAWQEG